MNHRDRVIRDLSAYTDVRPAPLAVYCALSDCNTLIRTGEPVKKIDGCTFIHFTCPSSGLKNFSAHKHPNTGMHIG
jgi:hypothetical protein